MTARIDLVDVEALPALLQGARREVLRRRLGATRKGDALGRLAAVHDDRDDLELELARTCAGLSYDEFQLLVSLARHIAAGDLAAALAVARGERR